MKTSLAVALIAVFLIQSSLSCASGQYSSVFMGKCTQCENTFTECTTATAGTVVSRLKGYNLDGSGNIVRWCVSGTNYNADKSQC